MLVSPLARSLCQPLAVPLTGASGILADPAAAAYIAAVESAKGSAVTPGQRAAITAFIRGEKSAARWDLHKRLYLPIWGQPAANAICLRSLATGTFVSGVTHGAGFIASDGTSGYMNTNTDFVTQGLTLASAHLFTLRKTNNTTNPAVAVGSGNTRTCYTFATTTSASFRWAASSSVVSATTSRTGIVSSIRHNGDRLIMLRNSAGSSVLATVTGADGGTMCGAKVFIMASNGSDSTDGIVPQFYDNSEIGAIGFGLGLTNASNADFTANLKTLWETCTGLPLP
jgi:hypothetical protein